MAQNALMRAWRHKHKLVDGERKQEWIARIARNEAFRERERRVPIPVETLETGAIEDENLNAVVESSAVWDALQALSEEEREILKLRYEADLTQSAIAEHLGIPEGTVKVKLYRTREKLRKNPDIV